MYPLFLLALFVVAGGITILQVAANPYISVLGPEESASARLNLAQAFNSFGTTLAPVVAASFLLGDQILSSEAIRALSEADRLAYYASEASAVQVPFVVLALAFFALAGVVGAITLPKILGGDSQTTTTYGQVLQNKKLLFGALGIFVYVGAEVALGSYMVNYGLSLDIVEEVKTSRLLGGMAGIAAFIKGMDVSGLDAKGILGALLTFYWGGAMLGRFAGSALMQRIRPVKLLVGAAFVALGLIGLSMLSQGVAALLLVLAVGFFNSIMFPTIFTLAIEDLGEGKPQGSGVLCTAIVGGAFIPPAMGALVDSAGFGVAFVLPMACYLYIAWYAGRLVPSMSS